MSYMLSNPDRVIPSQIKYISVVENQRYVPVDRRLVHPTGIVVLLDKEPMNPDEVAKGNVCDVSSCTNSE